MTRLAHLAVPPGLYQAVGVVAVSQRAGVTGLGLGTWGLVLAYACGAGMGVYLLDRVKRRNASLDPADAVAHPMRAAWGDRRASWWGRGRLAAGRTPDLEVCYRTRCGRRCGGLAEPPVYSWGVRGESSAAA